MEAIRIKAHQVLPNYRKKMSQVLAETYPLPPLSTVIGMIHKICGWTSYHPMKLCIHGDLENTLFDLYSCYTFPGNGSYDKERHNLYHEVDDKKVGLTKGTSYHELINEIDLTIYILPENEQDEKEILHYLEFPLYYPSLGRYEDLLEIEEFKKVSISETEEAQTKKCAYMPADLTESQNSGTIYLIDKNYTINPKTKKRMFEQIRMRLVAKNVAIENCFIDEENQYPLIFV